MVSLSLLALGLGLGGVTQVLVIIAQNGVPHRELGVATSGATFFPSIGGSLEAHDSAAAAAHVVNCLPGAEGLAAGDQLADEVRQGLVARVAAGLGAEHRGGVLGLAFPVEVEVRRAGVEEQEPGRVGRLDGACSVASWQVSGIRRRAGMNGTLDRL